MLAGNVSGSVGIEATNSGTGGVSVFASGAVTGTGDPNVAATVNGTEITVEGEKIADLPAGALNHHWTKSLIASPDGARLADFLQPAGASAYLVDPNGNWLLVYPSGLATQDQFKGMQKDIKKLLRLSQIG